MTPGRTLLALAALLWTPSPAAGAPPTLQSSLEYSVKANYLVRFAAFVEWPERAFATPQSPVVLCLVGRDAFKGALDRAARGQTAHGRPLEVRRPDSVENATACHILYVGRDGAALVPEGPGAILVITDAGASADRGMIHFVIHQGRVRFHIDLQTASRSRLSISSRLLNLALSVRGG